MSAKKTTEKTDVQIPTADLILAVKDELKALQTKYDAMHAENVRLREENCLREILGVLDKYRCSLAVLESQVQVKARD